ncbi:tetratricopeptide repeat protein [Nitrospira sp. M1]
MFDCLKFSCAFGMILLLFSCTNAHDVSIPDATRTASEDSTFQQLKTEGRLLGLEQKFFQAIEKLDVASTLRPDDAHVHLMLGEAYYHVGNRRESLSHLERSRALAPNNYQIESWLGTVHMGMGHLGEAEFAYTNVLTVKPNDYNALVYMGYIAFQKKDYRSCHQFFQRYKELVEVIDPARLTEQEKRRYQQATEYHQACDISWRYEARKLQQSL